eukprot:10752265-Alexandrium_andersonii.AAC.1
MERTGCGDPLSWPQHFGASFTQSSGQQDLLPEPLWLNTNPSGGPTSVFEGHATPSEAWCWKRPLPAEVQAGWLVRRPFKLAGAPPVPDQAC